MNIQQTSKDILLPALPDLTDLFSTEKPTSAVFEGGISVSNGSEPDTESLICGRRKQLRD